MIKAFFLFLVIFFGPKAYPPAQALSVKRDLQKNLFLEGENCRELREELTALREWSRKIGQEDEGLSLEDLPCLPQGPSFRIPLDTVIPEKLLKVTNTYPACHGPNCGQTALTLNNIFDEFLYGTREEITHILGSPLCRERSREEAPRPGDIVSVRSGKTHEEVHTFTYISPRLSFSKNGSHVEVPFGFDPLKTVFAIYDVDPPCERPASDEDRDGCPFYAVYSDCKTLEDFRKESLAKGELSPEALLASPLDPKLKELAGLEKNLCHRVLQGDFPLGSPSLEQMEDFLTALWDFSEDQLEQVQKQNPGPYLLLRWKILKNRVRSDLAQVQKIKQWGQEH